MGQRESHVHLEKLRAIADKSMKFKDRDTYFKYKTTMIVTDSPPPVGNMNIPHKTKDK